MFFPIFIPRYDDCSCDSKHGSGCQCPECLRKEELAKKPREYYESRYAIPKKWRTKNNLLKVISFIPLTIGFIIAFFILWNARAFAHPAMLFLAPICLVAVLILTAIISSKLNNKYVKYDFQCEEAIKLEKKWLTLETWEDIVRSKNIDLSTYYLTEPKENWRYK